MFQDLAWKQEEIETPGYTPNTTCTLQTENIRSYSCSFTILSEIAFPGDQLYKLAMFRRHVG